MRRYALCVATLLLAALTAAAQLVAPNPTRHKPSVAPLLKTTWAQGKPFNEQCPTKKDKDGVERHCPVGCVALALAQIMKYYNYPEMGQGSKTYKPLFGGGELSANFGETKYLWDKMRDNYFSLASYRNYSDDEADAVSTLCFHVGVSVGMMYQLSGSSAFAYGNIPRDMVENFRYDGEKIRYLKRADYTKEQWMDLIFTELSEGRPVFYSGNSPAQGGHAWVVDGYNATGEVHINWGWRGKSDDYFDIDLSMGENNYSQQQSMVIGIMPPKNSMGLNTTTSPRRVKAIYGLDGRVLPRLRKGVNIVKYMDGTTRKVVVR